MDKGLDSFELKVLKTREEVKQHAWPGSSLCTSACFSTLSSVETDPKKKRATTRLATDESAFGELELKEQ